MSSILEAREETGQYSVQKQLIIKSGPNLMKWRRSKGIPRPLFAKLVDFSERKLATYEKTENLPQKIKRPVNETIRLVQALKELAGESADLKEWLNKPNRAFRNRTPLSLITSGESSTIWEMVFQMRQGSYA